MLADINLYMDKENFLSVVHHTLTIINRIHKMSESHDLLVSAQKMICEYICIFFEIYTCYFDKDEDILKNIFLTLSKDFVFL